MYNQIFPRFSVSGGSNDNLYKVRIMNKKRYIQPITELLHTILEQPFLAGSDKSTISKPNGDGSTSTEKGPQTGSDDGSGADSKYHPWSAWEDLEDY